MIENNNERAVVTTEDGSKTIFDPISGENYHSNRGALQESLHVFVGMGLKHYLQNAPQIHTIRILEVGFGTGLNFLLSAKHCREQHIQLNYCGIEAFPLSQQMIASTDYGQFVPDDLWNDFVEHYDESLERPVGFNENPILHIAHSKLNDFNHKELFDIIYFDAFSSAGQPEMWDDEAIEHTCSFLKPGGIFVTYAITGKLKRCMKALGFTIEKVPGAPGKREMLRACKN